MHNWQLLLLKILKIFGPLAYGILHAKLTLTGNFGSRLL